MSLNQLRKINSYMYANKEQQTFNLERAENQSIKQL
jgi:hypothetical protein